MNNERKITDKCLRFLKDWTLPVAMTIGITVYFLFSRIPVLQPVGTFFSPIFYTIFPVFMFCILYITFCHVDFRRLRPVMWHLFVALFQVTFICILMGIILTQHPAVGSEELILLESLLCCVIAPCASAAPVVTQKLGGKLEQMTTYTFLSNFITALFIPICFPMVEKSADIGFLPALLNILHQVCIILLVPMFLAFLTKHFLHRLHRFILSVKNLSFYLWAISLAIISGITVNNIVTAEASALLLFVIALLGFVLCIVQFAVGRWIGHYFGSVVESGQGLGQKNTAFAIWISYTYLNPLSSVGPGCYVLWQNLINSIEIWQHMKKEKTASKQEVES